MSDKAQPQGSVQRTKHIPSIRVWANDLVVEDEEGNEYYPHAGEWVRFKRSVPIGVIETLGEIQAAQGLDPDEDRDQLLGIGGKLVDLILNQILDWNLTSDAFEEPGEDGEWVRLPHPRREREGARKALIEAENFLLIWLQEHMMDGAKNPNGSSSPPTAS